MKLLARYNRINLVASVLIFLLASVAFYFLLRYVLIRQVDDDLIIEQHEIELYVAKYNRLPETLPVNDQQISFAPAHDIKARRSFTSASSKDHHHKEEPVRQLKFNIQASNQWYQAIVSKSLEGTNEMTRSIIIITLATIFAMLIVSLLINRLVLGKLWRPFYKSLDVMKTYRLGQSKPGFETTSIEEFTLLNSTLEQAISNAETEYLRLKEFTENASHELQTPLAVIRSKLDVLIQDEHLSATQSMAAQSAYDAVNKLARLNQSLLLLSKIENRQFAGKVKLNLKELIAQKIIAFKEIWEERNFNISDSLQEKEIAMNSILAEVMLNNLFSNATRHTPKDGLISITLTGKAVSIANTAIAGPLDETRLFQRFYKGGQATDNQGLGLSIIRQICIDSGFTINYHFSGNEHHFIIHF